MQIEKLPFKIGMHYENWEFDLDVEEFTQSYDMYRYIKGDIKEFEGYIVTDIFLYFNLDILFQVEMYMEQGKIPFREFHKVENNISIRGVIEKQTNLIELTYNKHNIWREL